MRLCKTCGMVLSITRYKGSNKHIKKCAAATPEERAHFKRLGHWPKPGQTVKPLPAEVPEPPPMGAATRPHSNGQAGEAEIITHITHITHKGGETAQISNCAYLADCAQGGKQSKSWANS